MNLEGRCACGNIRYRLTAAPMIVHACHCRAPGPVCHGTFGAAWLRLKQTDLIPGKEQFRSRFPQSAQLRLSDNNFRDPGTITDILSATLLDGRAGNGWARLLRCGRDRSGGGFSNAGYEPHPSCDDCSLTARSRPKRAAKTSRKIVAGQQ